MGERFEFDTRVRSVARIDGRPVSSTRIREAIVAGDLADVERMLGRPYSVLGTVVRGQGRGRRIGIPTANLGGALELLPPVGVYRTEARLGERACAAVTNVGRRPTFREDGERRPVVTVETHIPGFEGNLVGASIEVVFLEKIRDERAFQSAEELVRQIRSDIEWARRRATNRPERREKV
jgi:riboflavin kinase/FMN adenylyltransferase